MGRLTAFITVALMASSMLMAEEAAGKTVKLDNHRCIDGQPVDPKLDPVLVKLGDTAYFIHVASKENAEAVRKMKPDAALRAVVAFNRELANQVVLP
jgi:hypothetical protein